MTETPDPIPIDDVVNVPGVNLNVCRIPPPETYPASTDNVARDNINTPPIKRFIVVFGWTFAWTTPMPAVM